MKRFLIVAILFSLASCTTTLPSKVVFSPTYSLLGVKSYSLGLTRDNVILDPTLNKAFLENYCTVLESSIKIAMGQTLPEFRYIAQGDPDIKIDVALEMLHGGDAAARLMIGYGAGASISTIYVRVHKGTDLISEGRLTETTSFYNIAAGNYENDQAVLQDAPRLAKKVANFVADPKSQIQPKSDQAGGGSPFGPRN